MIIEAYPIEEALTPILTQDDFSSTDATSNPEREVPTSTTESPHADDVPINWTFLLIGSGGGLLILGIASLILTKFYI